MTDLLRFYLKVLAETILIIVTALIVVMVIGIIAYGIAILCQPLFTR